MSAWPEQVPWHDAESVARQMTDELFAIFADAECRDVARRAVFNRLDYSWPKTYQQLDQMRADAWNAAMRELGYTEVTEAT